MKFADPNLRHFAEFPEGIRLVEGAQFITICENVADEPGLEDRLKKAKIDGPIALDKPICAECVQAVGWPRCD